MKKFLFLITSIFLMASCSKNDVNNENSLRAITFDTEIDNTLKSSTFGTIDLAALKSSADGFAVSTKGLGTGAEMNSLAVKYSGGAWTYAGDYFWPLNATQNVSFVAYAPAGTANVTLIDTNLTVTNFIPAPSAANQIDLLYAPPANFNRSASGTSGVTFVFNHILTQVAFSITTDIPSADNPKIVSIVLTVPNSKGNFNGTNWTALSNPQTYTVFSNNPISNTAISSTPLLMIPQTLVTGTNAVITFSVNNVQSSNTVDLSTLTSVTSWQKGYKVTYNISFVAADLKIKFGDPTVGSFTNASDGITY